MIWAARIGLAAGLTAAAALCAWLIHTNPDLWADLNDVLGTDNE